jgi:hypothetical protein
MLLLIVFVELEVVSLLYFNSNVGSMVVIFYYDIKTKNTKKLNTNVYLNFISGRLDEIQKIAKEVSEKIGNSNEIPKDQDENYLIRTIDSIYHRMKIFQKNILHLHSDSVYCLS